MMMRVLLQYTNLVTIKMQKYILQKLGTKIEYCKKKTNKKSMEEIVEAVIISKVNFFILNNVIDQKCRRKNAKIYISKRKLRV